MNAKKGGGGEKKGGDKVVKDNERASIERRPGCILARPGKGRRRKKRIPGPYGSRLGFTLERGRKGKEKEEKTKDEAKKESHNGPVSIPGLSSILGQGTKKERQGPAFPLSSSEGYKEKRRAGGEKGKRKCLISYSTTGNRRRIFAKERERKAVWGRKN